MPSAKNIATVSRIQEQLQQAKSVVLADYRGLTVADMQALRAQIRAVGGTLTVAKNTLIKLALTGLPRDPLQRVLRGPTALILGQKDPLAPIKALVDFAKNHALNLPTPKAGIMDDRVLTIEDIQTIAALPSRDQLIAQLLGQLQAPLYGLANVLQGNLRSLVYVLRNKGGEN